jgi:hypothetical protein
MRTRSRTLLKAGLIELVSRFLDTADGRLAAQYKLGSLTAAGGARGSVSCISPKSGIGLGRHTT